MLKSKILIVEDEHLVADDIKERLESMGYIVTGISISEEDAIKKTGETNPDLILMDVKLGSGDGIKAAQQIKERYEIPFIYLTGYYDDEILKRAAMTQPAGYITKPFDDIGLHSAIQVALYRQKYEQNTKK
jgi:two-component system, response regulator PdtaR